MEQASADANPPVAHIEPNGALTGAHPALPDDLLAGRFFSIDVRGQVTGWNPRAEAAFGWSTHHVSGESLFDKLLVSGVGFSSGDLDEFFTTFRRGIWAVLMPVIMLGGIYTGWFTATAPSTTETTDPPMPADTAKMVPLTDAMESRVRTRRLPRRCLAALTMMSPRWR